MKKNDANTGVYSNARRLAVKEYSRYISQGRNGYLPFLEGILKNIDIISEVNLGTIELPLKKVRGTYTYMRSVSFARNFMPLMNETSEFAAKWRNVYEAQITEGLRDSLKVYEYLNWFYVVEGNKRVSVLKYLDVYSYSANVIRLIPKYDEESKDIRIYYEFLDFYKKTGINSIWFSQEGRFEELWSLIKNYNPKLPLLDWNDRYKYLVNALYLVFRKLYYELGGNSLPITTGDAFLDYIKLNGVPEAFEEKELRSKLKRFLIELKYYKVPEAVEVQTQPKLKEKNSIITRFKTILKSEKVKVGFMYAKTVNISPWTYGHDMGRMHVEAALKGKIQTITVDRVPENIKAYDFLKKLIEKDCKVIFTTSPSFLNATLKAALEYPDILFFNCSASHSFKHVHTYFGRIYEPRFLSGIIAGVMTRSDKLGYVGTFPIPEVISGVNAFALGAKMVNPFVKVEVVWTKKWDDAEGSRNLSILLSEKGADIISHHNTLSNPNFSKEYGVYTMLCDVDEGLCEPNNYLAVPVWNWGIFYEKILRSILTGAYKTAGDVFTAGQKPVRNYWWGLDSGILDLFYSKSLVPIETQKLVELIKKAIMSNAFKVFTGPIYDREGVLRVNKEDYASREKILSMDWLLDIVEGELPDMSEFKDYTGLSTGKTTLEI